MIRPSLVYFCDWSQLSLAGDDDHYRPSSGRSDDTITYKGHDLSEKLSRHKRFLAALTKGERAIVVGREQNAQTESRYGRRRRTDGHFGEKTRTVHRASSASSAVGRRSPWPIVTIDHVVSKKTLYHKYEIPKHEEDSLLAMKNPAPEVLIEPRLLKTYKWRRKGGHVVVRDMLVPGGDGTPSRKAYVDVHLPKIESEGPILRLTHRH